MKDQLVERRRREGLDNCLFFPPVRKTLLAEITGRLDCGLMVLANVPAFYYGTSPNKFFDYLAAGLPVVNNYPGWFGRPDHPERLWRCGRPKRPGGFRRGANDARRRAGAAPRQWECERGNSPSANSRVKSWRRIRGISDEDVFDQLKQAHPRFKGRILNCQPSACRMAWMLMDGQEPNPLAIAGSGPGAGFLM